MNIAATLPPAMDEDTLEQLIDVVRKFVNERLIPLEAQVAEEDRPFDRGTKTKKWWAQTQIIFDLFDGVKKLFGPGFDGLPF